MYITMSKKEFIVMIFLFLVFLWVFAAFINTSVNDMMIMNYGNSNYTSDGKPIHPGMDD